MRSAVDGYRCFFLDAHGHFQDVTEFHAASKAEAESVAWAAFSQSQFPRFELWCNGRPLSGGERPRPQEALQIAVGDIP